MTDFEWLSDDRQVQRTEFGDTVEIFANFGTDPFEYKKVLIPERSVVARWIDTGKTKVVFLWSHRKQLDLHKLQSEGIN